MTLLATDQDVVQVMENSQPYPVCEYSVAAGPRCSQHQG